MKSLARWARAVDPHLLLLFALSLPALAPLLGPGYFYEAHDGRHSVFYQVMFDASFQNGALWPRWAMHHLQGYGYPTFVILAPLGFYLSELFVLLGAGFTLAAKLTWATGVLFSGWGMYRLLLHWMDAAARAPGQFRLDSHRLAALAGALIYVYAPYRLLDIYVRGALNESLLLLWLPWLFLAFDRLLILGPARGWTRRLALALLALAATWLTHSFAILSVTPLLVAFILFRLATLWAGDRRGRALATRTGMAAGAGIGALLLCAVFLAPLLAESPLLDQRVYTSDTYNYRNHFVYLGQYLSPFWGYGYSDDPAGAGDGMGFQVGAVGVVVAMAGMVLLWRSRLRALMLFLALASLGLLIFMGPPSRALWDAVPMLAVIQFPWRLLLLASFTVCTLAGLTLAQVAEAAPRPEGGAGLLAIALLAVYASAGYADPALQPVEPWREDGRAVFRFEQQFPDMIVGTQWTQQSFTTSPMSDGYARDDYTEDHGRTAMLERLAVVEGAGEVLGSVSAGSRFGGTVRLATPGVVRVNLLYFPGWQARMDGTPVAMRVAPPYGLIDLDVPAGEHELSIIMGATPARRLGTLISWLTLVAVLALSIWPSRGAIARLGRAKRG